MHLVMEYGLWIVFAGILLDNAGVPLPGELFLLVGGMLARHGDPTLVVVVAVGTAAAVSGDNVSYWMGRRWGGRLLHAYCRLMLHSEACVARAAGYYQRHGTATVLFGRFVVGLRALLSPLAGSARVPFVRFILLDVVGAALWSALFVVAGYSLGARLDDIHDWFRMGSFAAAGAGGAIALYVFARSRRARS